MICVVTEITILKWHSHPSRVVLAKVTKLQGPSILNFLRRFTQRRQNQLVTELAIIDYHKQYVVQTLEFETRLLQMNLDFWAMINCRVRFRLKFLGLYRQPNRQKKTFLLQIIQALAPGQHEYKQLQAQLELQVAQDQEIQTVSCFQAEKWKHRETNKHKSLSEFKVIRILKYTATL